MEVDILKRVMLIGVIMTCMFSSSTLLVIYNKWLLSDCPEGSPENCRGWGFPHPVTITFVHMVFIWALSAFVIHVLKYDKKPQVEHDNYVKSVVPFGILVGLDIAFTNSGFVTLEASFVEMIKSAIPAVVLTSTILLGLEPFSWSIVVAVLSISLGLGIASAGEANFVLSGFLLELAAVLMGSFRMVLSQVLLHHGGSLRSAQDSSSSSGLVDSEPLSSLQVLYLQTPISAAVLMLPSVVISIKTFPGTRFTTDLAYMLQTLAILAVGAVLAFLLDLANLLMVKYTSALSSVVASNVKTIIVIIFSWLFFRNEITAMNVAGYGICMIGVTIYNVIKYRKLMDAQKERSQDRPTYSVADPEDVAFLRSDSEHSAAAAAQAHYTRADGG